MLDTYFIAGAGARRGRVAVLPSLPWTSQSFGFHSVIFSISRRFTILVRQPAASGFADIVPEYFVPTDRPTSRTPGVAWTKRPYLPIPR